jgi:hypothetical protein
MRQLISPGGSSVNTLASLLADLGHPRRHADPTGPLRPEQDPYTEKHTSVLYECGQLFIFEGGEINWLSFAGAVTLAAVALTLVCLRLRRRR